MRRTEVEWMVSMVNVLFKLYVLYCSVFPLFPIIILYFSQKLQIFGFEMNEKVLPFVHNKLENELLAKQEELSPGKRTAKLDFLSAIISWVSCSFRMHWSISNQHTSLWVVRQMDEWTIRMLLIGQSVSI